MYTGLMMLGSRATYGRTTVSEPIAFEIEMVIEKLKVTDHQELSKS
jgi:hypothetical protein